MSVNGTFGRSMAHGSTSVGRCRSPTFQVDSLAAWTRSGGAAGSSGRATFPVSRRRRAQRCRAAMGMHTQGASTVLPSLDIAQLPPQTVWPPHEDLTANRVRHLRSQHHFESELERAEDRLVRGPWSPKRKPETPRAPRACSPEPPPCASPPRQDPHILLPPSGTLPQPGVRKSGPLHCSLQAVPQPEPTSSGPQPARAAPLPT